MGETQWKGSVWAIGDDMIWKGKRRDIIDLRARLPIDRRLAAQTVPTAKQAWRLEGYGQVKSVYLLQRAVWYLSGFPNAPPMQRHFMAVWVRYQNSGP